MHAFNATRTGRIHQAQSILRLAEQFARYDAIYYPHVLDFRGRYYPVPFYLHPQGTDLARGLLTYADAMPVNEENGGIRWLAISLASNWGHDKLPFEDRIAWVYENEEMFRLIAADPYANNAWFHEADKPWQTLAGILDWVDYLDAAAAGREHWSSIPVMIDGTCNGIQHLSAIVRDRIGGEHVNLTPSDRPRDIYKFVAEDLQETVERIAASVGAQGELAKWWLRVCDGELPRSLTKRQVMVLPYGGTKDSFFGYTREWLTGNVPEEELEDRELVHKLVVFLSTHMWDSVKTTIRAAEEVMGWLKACAREAAIADQPIFWVVPSGFTVRHFYGELRTTRVKLSLEGKVVKVSLGDRSPKLSVKEQLQGIAPNFIHSLDASCLTECVNLCLDAGITSITAVHDAYGTHAANMDALAQFTREAFVKTHEEDVLGAFRAACIEVIVDEMMLKDPHLDPLEAFEKADAKLPAPLDTGDLDLAEVLHSRYFFH